MERSRIDRRKSSVISEYYLPRTNYINKPILTRSEYLALSFSDVRRISAFRAEQRIREKERLAHAKYKKGLRGWQTPEESQFGDSTVKAVEETWKIFENFDRIHGIRLLVKYLQDNPSHIHFYRHLWIFSGDEEKSGIVLNRYAHHQGRNLIRAIGLIVANLRSEVALRDMVERYFDRLMKKGVRKKHVEEARASFDAYLPIALGSQWTPKVEADYKTVLDALRDTGFEYWVKIGYLVEKRKVGENADKLNTRVMSATLWDSPMSLSKESNDSGSEDSN